MTLTLPNIREILENPPPEVVEQRLDLYTYIVSKHLSIPYESVTKEQRCSIKLLAHGLSYGVGLPISKRLS